MTRRSLDIVIVNYESGDHLRECLASLSQCEMSGVDLRRVVIVDNGSSDGSTNHLAYPLPLVVHRTGRNRGFAVAANRGASGSDADYILFLNPDVRLAADSITSALRGLEKHSNDEVGVIGIQLRRANGSEVTRSCARFPDALTLISEISGAYRVLPRYFQRVEMSEWDHMSTRLVDHVIGSFYLISRDAFDRVGHFDEGFFLYYEDLDLSRRVAREGYRVLYWSEASAIHVGGACSKQMPWRRLWYAELSRWRYAFKHLNVIGGCAVLTASITIGLAARAYVTLERFCVRRSPPGRAVGAV